MDIALAYTLVSQQEKTLNVSSTYRPISELAGSFMQGQINKQKAKATLAQTKAEAEAEIMRTVYHTIQMEIIMAQGTQNSFKDELVTIVILIPTILVFIRAWKKL